MEHIIVAFEGANNAKKMKEILETAGTAFCHICRSAAEVKRLVRKTNVNTIVCGFKLPDDSCESLWSDLPDRCNMLMIAPQDRLELLQQDGIFKLAAPVKKGDLLGAVQMLLQLSHRAEHHPQRTAEEQALVAAAKQILMSRYTMTESEAHRFLQKQSMDRGMKLIDVARSILAGE